MASSRSVVLAVPLVLAGASAASAREPVGPRAGVLLSGAIDFPRQQNMAIQTDAKDGTKLTVMMGFDGKCKGGGLGEIWSSNVPARPLVRVADGRFAATLTGTMRKLGGVENRT